MNQQDRDRVKQAFLEAAKSPAAEERIEFLDVSLREVLEAIANDEQEFAALEREVDSGEKTPDQIISELQAKFPPPAP